MPDDEFQRMLDMDPLLAAEGMTGKSYKEDESTSKLGIALHMLNGERKRAELSRRDDTHYSTSWMDMVRIYSDLGFRIVHQHRFPSARHDTESDVFIVLWRPDGVLATAESYGAGTNTSKLYYNWRPHTDVNSWEFTSSGHFHLPSYDRGDKVWIGDHDVRKALRHKLSRLEAHGSFVTPWVEQPFLWLLDYGQARVPDCQYQSINSNVIGSLPLDVRESLTPTSPKV